MGFPDQRKIMASLFKANCPRNSNMTLKFYCRPSGLKQHCFYLASPMKSNPFLAWLEHDPLLQVPLSRQLTEWPNGTSKKKKKKILESQIAFFFFFFFFSMSSRGDQSKLRVKLNRSLDSILVYRYGLAVHAAPWGGGSSGVTGGGRGAECPPETSDREIFADVSGKKRQGKKGKMCENWGKLRRKEGKL